MGKNKQDTCGECLREMRKDHITTHKCKGAKGIRTMEKTKAIRKARETRRTEVLPVRRR